MTTKYLVDTQNHTGYAQVVEELQGATVTKQFTFGHDLILQRIGSNISFYQYDGHGSVRQLTNAAGVITDTYTYDAFGNLISRTGTTSNDYLYAGEQFDANLGFYYLRARYMNPSNGRFHTQDSYEGSISDPISLHKYLYANANPADRTDPSGNFSIAIEVGALGMRSTLSSMSTLQSIAVAAAITCAVDYAVTGTLNEAGVGLQPITPCDARNQENRVYRGTDRFLENTVFAETGHILSDAALESYAETGSLATAYASAAITHEKWNRIWGNEIFHAQAHGAFGIEMPREFGMQRTFVSVTRRLDIARLFAGPTGKIYTAVVPRWEMVPQTLRGAGEGEWLIRLGRGGFRVYE